MAEPDRLKLVEVFSGFLTESSFRAATRIGSGHINDTFHITTEEPGAGFVLQRINSSVFKDIPGLMRNIGIVTRHLEDKIRSGDPHARNLSAIRLIPARDQNLFLEDRMGDSWRLYNFIEGTKSHDIVENPEMAHKGGRAFGLFQYLTSDIAIETLKETIPRFHDILFRLDSFHRVILLDPEKRVKELHREIEFVKQREAEMRRMPSLIQSGKSPLRVTHNDTKFNNILFDQNNDAVCIVDLDTVMPGTVLYDYGDAIRTGANRAAEDERELDKVGIDLDLFKEYTRGYLETAGRFLNPSEISHLAFSARFMTFIIGLRFLTDHIDGDHYYRVAFPGHNLQRARAQFRLLESMEESASRMEAIVEQAAVSH
jgi:Ser/Thr protein kinase RdoA (MazF antagonist)